MTAVKALKGNWVLKFPCYETNEEQRAPDSIISQL